MTQPDLSEYLTSLQSKRAEIGDEHRLRGTSAIESTADAMDQTQGAQVRDLAIGAFDRNAKVLRDLQSALGRIQAGTFGMCLDCECDIGKRRLAAIPWASSCIVCQEEADRRAGEPLRMTEQSFDRAA